MRSKFFIPIVIAILLGLDLYVFQAVKASFSHANSRSRLIVFAGYWLVALLCWIVVCSLPYWRASSANSNFKLIIITLILGIYLGKIIASIFFLIDDIRRGGMWIFSLFGQTRISTTANEIHGITRSQFLSRLGLLLGGSMLATLIYGFSNKYDYHIRRIRLRFSSLPSAFRGLKIVQVSDIHCGSFDNREKVEKGVEMILKEKPDVIFFTGDLVNNRSDEMYSWMETFSRLKAPMGVYSVLGNHDYGDYM